MIMGKIIDITGCRFGRLVVIRRAADCRPYGVQEEGKGMESKKSPCESCTISTNPAACQKKICTVWRAWWLSRWELIFAYGQKHT